MKKFKQLIYCLGLAVLVASTQVWAQEEESKVVYISIDSDALQFSEKTFGARVEEVETLDGISIVRIDEESLPWLSMLMHRNFNRCGGFMLHDDEGEAMDLLYSQNGSQLFAKNNSFTSYSITQEQLVRPMLSRVSDANIYADIVKLSSFKNRYYKGQHGKDSAAWIKDRWENLVKHRTDATVEYFPHAKWDQPSIILTLKGDSDDVIIVGGHQDSISGMWGGANSTAPGADDNASGIATITEIVKILIDHSYRPQKTIKFMAYAAEEVGLLGSKEISNSFKTQNINVVGVLQLDMTNYKGTKNLDIVLMRDYTNDDQNQFIGKLIDSYIPDINWGYDKCGYGCSDHASWHAAGYPASMPFEARMSDMNKNIHTGRDTVESLGKNANHAAKFAKMGVAYVVELDR